MTFIDNHKVKKVGGERLEKARPALVFGKRLVDREIHLAALDDFARLDLVSGVAEGREEAIFWLINKDVAVGEVKDTGATMFARPVPAGRPQFPANLESHEGFPCASCHRQ
jgi:hypothetical protein